MDEIFIDTSALYAFLVRDDRAHEEAVGAWTRLARARARLVTSSYVVCEAYALLGRRHGRDGVARLRTLLRPVRVVWMDEPLHEQSLERLFAEDRAGLSLVDASSFVVAESLGIRRALAFDLHFDQAGFERP